MSPGSAAAIAPVEYAVAVEHYLSAAELGPGSRRVYRISLTSWAWPLVGKLPPAGRARRLATPPIVPLAVLEDADAAGKLAAALAHRIRRANARTVNRELSALRSAITWWQDRHWIGTDPTVALRQIAGQPVALPPLTETERAALYAAPVGLREQALWHLLHDTGMPAESVLALGAGDIHLSARRARLPRAGWVEFSDETAALLGWLLAGRRSGPAFLTDRRAAAGAPQADVCPLTGRGRISYRRAAEVFTEVTRPLDAAGRGWTLHQLRRPSRMLAGPAGQQTAPPAAG